MGLDSHNWPSLHLGLDVTAATSVPPVRDTFSVNVNPRKTLEEMHRVSRGDLKAQRLAGVMGSRTVDDLGVATLGGLWKNFGIPPTRLGYGSTAVASALQSITASQRVTGGAASYPGLGATMSQDRAGGAVVPSVADWALERSGLASAFALSDRATGLGLAAVAGSRGPASASLLTDFAARSAPVRRTRVAPVATLSPGPVAVVASPVVDPLLEAVQALTAEVRGMRDEARQGGRVDRRWVSAGVIVALVTFFGYERTEEMLSQSWDGLANALELILRGFQLH